MSTDPAWTTCSGCRGYGIVESFGPSVVDCDVCGGSGQERRRDERGRFVGEELSPHDPTLLCLGPNDRMFLRAEDDTLTEVQALMRTVDYALFPKTRNT